MQNFTDKLVVITGGASGVGRSLAFALGAEGARVLIADVDEEGLRRTEAELIQKNIAAFSQVCDVTKQESLDALAGKAFDELGGAHVVFANAGIAAGEQGAIWDYNAQDWQWTFEVNFWGAVNSVNAFMPRLAAQNEDSHMVITGSANGAFLYYPDQPVYSASKAAVMALTETLYLQMTQAQSPIKIHALLPGPHIVDTGLFDSDRVRPEALARPEGAPDKIIRSTEDLRQIMEGFGMELKTTHPDEVAQIALDGLKADQFWIAPLNDGAKGNVQARFDSILNRTNPPVPTLG